MTGVTWGVNKRRRLEIEAIHFSFFLFLCIHISGVDGNFPVGARGAWLFVGWGTSLSLSILHDFFFGGPFGHWELLWGRGTCAQATVATVCSWFKWNISLYFSPFHSSSWTQFWRPSWTTTTIQTRRQLIPMSTKNSFVRCLILWRGG